MTSISWSRPPVSIASENARATATGFCELATIGNASSLTKSPAFFSIESTTIEAALSFPAFTSSSSLTSLSKLFLPKVVIGDLIVVPRTPISPRRANLAPLPTKIKGSRKNIATVSIAPETRSAEVLSFSK